MAADRELDVVVVGAGIVGLATAHAIAEARPALRIAVVDKERRLAAHQSGRNSGVLHSGLYYRPGSEKARMAVGGRQAMVAFCQRHGIAHEVCGKVVVATDEGELGRLAVLEERATANGVRVERIGAARLRELEPHARGVAALHVPEAGIVDFVAVCDVLARGRDVRLGVQVRSIREVADGNGVVVETDGDELRAGWAVNCAGLHADVLAGDAARAMGVRIVPFRGEFHSLVPGSEHLVRNLLYPVPDPAFPFLGVHLTRDVHGGAHAGPNAVLALSREGYRWRDVDRREVSALLRFGGVRQLARTHWRTGAAEVLRSVAKSAFVRALQRLVPDVTAADLRPAPAGVRAQAVRVDGSLVDDFLFAGSGRVVHVLNAPSPAATASLDIGASITRELLGRMDG